MILKSNNIVFSGYIGSYVNMTVNGITKKYFIKRASPHDSFDDATMLSSTTDAFAVLSVSADQSCQQ
jgi:hypothetical protein